MIDILIWWVLIEITGISVLPITLKLFKSLPDSGYPISRIFGLILLSYLCWLTVILKFFPYTPWTIGMILLLIFTSSWFYSSILRKQAILFLETHRKLVLYYETIGLLAFILMLLVRSFNPDIFGAEKFMDFGILNSLIRATQLPPPDPWLSGYSIHYYYFGHLLFSTLSKLSHVDSAYTYNYALATLAFFSALLSASLGYNLKSLQEYSDNINPSKPAMKAGVLTVFMVCFLGNLDGFIQLLQKGSIFLIDYWQSSRVIPNTINEFPFFSFLQGDLHAHLLNLPVFLLLLLCMLLLHIESKITIGNFLCLGFVLGVSNAINPWISLPSYILLVLLFAYRPKQILYFPLLLVYSFIIFLPYFMNLSGAYHGIGFVTTPTTLYQWLVVSGLFFFILLSWFIAQFTKSNRTIFLLTGSIFIAFVMGVISRNLLLGLFLVMTSYLLYLLFLRKPSLTFSFILILLASAFLLFIFCELIYFKDPFSGTLYRMNTVFKFYFAGWILLSIACGYITIRVQSKSGYLYGAILGLLIACGIYPLGAVYSYNEGFRKLPSLNGTQYLSSLNPGDKESIDWIDQHIQDTPVILEYSGDPYSYSSRISSNTGLPTILGWANHENVWRNNTQLIEERYRDIQDLYTSQDIQYTKKLINKYHIQYIVIGDLELENYPNDILSKWNQLGTTVFTSGKTNLIEIR